MEGKFSKTRENIADTLGIPMEIAMDTPKITIEGNKKVIVENHRGLKVFESDLVKVNSKIGTIKIEGEKFHVLFIGGETLTIGGIIKSVEYENDEDV